MAVALLVAAGSGERLGASRPKAFVVVAGRTMLEWSLATLRAVPEVEHVVVALPPGEVAPVGTQGVPGGPSRSHSVREALRAAPSAADGLVVVHDAARPLAGPELFTRALAALEGADAAIAAAPVTDTVKRGDAERRVTATLDRAGLWAIQTPQAFRAETLRRALDVPDDVLAAATDDASLVEREGGTVRLIESPPENLKITTPLDLRIAEALLAERERPC